MLGQRSDNTRVLPDTSGHNINFISWLQLWSLCPFFHNRPLSSFKVAIYIWDDLPSSLYYLSLSHHSTILGMSGLCLRHAIAFTPSIITKSQSQEPSFHCVAEPIASLCSSHTHIFTHSHTRSCTHIGVFVFWDVQVMWNFLCWCCCWW